VATGGTEAVLQKRFDPEASRKSETGDNAALVSGEAARSASETPAANKPEEKKEENLSLFWRVFGGTIISMVALGVLTLYNNLSTNISELRRELNLEREARSDLVKKDEFKSLGTSQSERIRAAEGLKGDIEALRERANTHSAAIESLKREATAGLDGIRKELSGTIDAVKKDAAAIELLKERVTALEGLKKDVSSLETIKERLAALTADLKLAREEIVRIQQEQERNKAADLERKVARDAQYKQTEDILRELQRGVQECREKLARLEALQGPARGSPVPADNGNSRPAAKRD
jgi:chromosome segregation ATPase